MQWKHPRLRRYYVVLVLLVFFFPKYMAEVLRLQLIPLSLEGSRIVILATIAGTFLIAALYVWYAERKV